MSEGHLETHRHRESTERVEWCCSDQISQWWSGISDQNSTWDQGSELTRSSGGEPGIELAVSLICLSQTSQSRVAQLKQQMQARDGFQGSYPQQCYIRSPFVYRGKGWLQMETGGKMASFTYTKSGVSSFQFNTLHWSHTENASELAFYRMHQRFSGWLPDLTTKRSRPSPVPQNA